MSARPFILGLTGSIGMGKSWAANAFRRCGLAVHDADKTVHTLLGPGGAAVDEVARAFPGMKKNNAIDRKKLGALVFANPEKLAKLEAILHPLVFMAQRAFIAAHARRRTRAVVLDIPLLFETSGQLKTDAVCVVSAPPFVQRPRVFARPGMDAKRLAAIEAHQLPDAVKCALADFIIPTGRSVREGLRVIDEIVKVANTASPHAWGPHWGRQ